MHDHIHINTTCLPAAGALFDIQILIQIRAHLERHQTRETTILQEAIITDQIGLFQ